MKFYLCFLLVFHAYCMEFPVTKSLKLENSLEVLLISSQKLDFSGMCLQVSVGASFEPRNLNGLAHLLEHMLHYASKTFPKEETFREILTFYNGRSNAMTSDRETTYYFTLENADFHALSLVSSVFAHFFIDPLLEEEAVSREIRAVHNEFSNDLTRNEWRFHELLRDLSTESSLFRHFSVGNLEKLAISSQISKELRSFFEKYYSAHRMKLVIFGDFPVNALETLAFPFKNVKIIKDFAKPAHFFTKSPAFPKENRGKLVVYEPIGPQRRTFAVVFPFEGRLLAKKARKTLEFLRKLIDFKGKHGLWARVRRFVKEIETFSVEKHVDLRLLVVKFRDFRRKNRVLREFFAFFKEISRNSKRLRRIYEEIAWMQYNFKGNSANDGKKTGKSKEVVDEMLEFLEVFKEFGEVTRENVAKSQAFPPFRREIVMKFLKYVANPRNCLIITTSSHVKTEKVQQKPEKVEKVLRFRRKSQRKDEKFQEFRDEVMRFSFKTRKIPKKLLISLTKPAKNSRFPHFFPQSAYFPSNFSLKTRCPLQKSRISLENGNFSTIFSSKRDFLSFFLRKPAFPRDFSANTANSSCFRRELLKDLSSNPRKLDFFQAKLHVLTDRTQGPRISAAFSVELRGNLKETQGFRRFFEALRAVLLQKLRLELPEIEEMWGKVAISSKKRGVLVRFDGFSGGFLNVFAQVFASFKEILKGKVEKTAFFRSFQGRKPEKIVNFHESKHKILMYYANRLFLRGKRPFVREKAVRFSAFLRFVRFFRRNFKIQGLIVGNFLITDAKQQILPYFLENFPELLKKSPKTRDFPRFLLRKSDFPSFRNENSGQTLVFRTISSNLVDENSAVLNIYLKKAYNLTDLRVLRRFLGVLHSKAFSFLRTQRQLGYIVGVSLHFSKRFAGFGVLVQGCRHKTQELDHEIEVFLNKFRASFEDFPEIPLLRAENARKSRDFASFRRWRRTFRKSLREKREKLWKKLGETPKFKEIAPKLPAKQEKLAFLRLFEELTGANRTKISLQIASFHEKTTNSTEDLAKIAEFLRT